MTSRYVVACWCDGPEWVVHVPALDRAGSASRLAEVPAVARALVAAWAENAGAVEFDFQVLPDALGGELARVRTALPRGAESRVEVVAVRNAVAWRLATEGMCLDDLDAVAGLPARWVDDLAGDRPVDGTGTGPDDGPSMHSAAAHDAYRHEALLYDDDAGYLAGCVPFVREGLALGQPVMVAVPTRQLELLRDALGADAGRVRLVDMTEMGRNPARIIPAWRRFVDAAGGRPVRGIGEPIWADRRAAELLECQFHESLLNLAVDPTTPLWLRCPYDTSALPAPVLAEAAHSHPVVVVDAGSGGSPRYGGLGHVERMFAADLVEPAAPVETLVFGAAALTTVRRAVIRTALAAGLDPTRTADLALAVGEIARDSVHHGGGRGVLRTWRDGDAFVCEVSDEREVTDPMIGRRAPHSAPTGRDGAWLANQLCDLVQIRSAPRGSVFRVVSWL